MLVAIKNDQPQFLQNYFVLFVYKMIHHAIYWIKYESRLYTLPLEQKGYVAQINRPHEGLQMTSYILLCNSITHDSHNLKTAFSATRPPYRRE